MQICDELQMLSPQELRQIETTARDLRKSKSVSELLEQKDENDDLDFDEDGWLRPKPEHVQEFMRAWYGCLEGMTEEDFYKAKLERITGEPQ
jgi:hypothetical protein